MEELVSGSGASGVFEFSGKTAYNPDGTVAKTGKDYAGQDVLTVTTQYQYDSLQLNVISETVADTMAAGASTTLALIGKRTYDSVTGRLLSVIGPYQSGGTAGPTVVYSYDTFGRVTDVGRQEGANTYEVAASGYYFAGQAGSGSSGPVSWSASFGGLVAYPASRSLPSSDDVVLSTTYYDAVGRAVQMRTRTGTGVASSSSQIIQHLAAGQYLVNATIYDGAGRLLERLDPYYSSNSGFQDFNAGGANAELSTANLHGTSLGYDAKSRPVCQVFWPVSGAISAAPSPCTSNFASSGYRRASATVYGTGLQGNSNTSYMTISVVPDWQNTTSPPPAAPIKYVNAAGWTMYEQDANANTVSLQHDVLGRATSVTRHAGGASGTPSVTTSASYDLKGRVIQQTDDSFGTRVFAYSASGELVKIGLNPTAKVSEGWSGVEFLYGSLGRLEKKSTFSWSEAGSCGTATFTRSTAVAAFYHYDTPAGVLKGSGATGYTYTAGRLAYESNAVATIAFGYDWAGHTVVRDAAYTDYADASNVALANTVQQTLANDGRLLATQVTSQALGASSPVQYFTSYDSLGRPVRVDDGETTMTTYWAAYNPASAIPTSSPYDPLARLATTWLDNGASSHTYQFNAGSNLETARTASVTPSGQTAPSWLFNASATTYLGAKLTGYTETVSGNSYSYSYDTDGRLSQATAATTTVTALVPAVQQNFRETNSFFTSGSASLWNLQTVNDQNSGVTSTYAMNYSGSQKGEQLASISYIPAANPPQSDTYNYDANGRVTAHLKANLTVQQFSYDPEGHLTQVVGSSGTEQLSYDPTGALAVRNQSGNKTIYVGASMTLTVSAGVATGKLHVLLGGGRVATIPVSGAALYYHRDRLGSIIATSTVGGAAGAYYRYSPYGALDKTSGETNSTISELGYTGALRLTEGLIYLNARVYNPQMRRFLQPDSVDPKRYTYASGDSINYTDPTGLRSNEWRAERDPGYGQGFSFATSATGNSFQPYGLAAESCQQFGCSDPSQQSTLADFVNGWNDISPGALPESFKKMGTLGQPGYWLRGGQVPGEPCGSGPCTIEATPDKWIPLGAVKVLHGVLDLAAVVPYAIYYGSFQYMTEMNKRLGSIKTTPLRYGAQALFVPYRVTFDLAQVAGLGLDAGIDWIKGHTVNDESFADEGVYGYANPLHGFMDWKGPLIYLPGIHYDINGVLVVDIAW